MRKKKEEKKKIISNLCVQMRTEITEGEGRRVGEWGPLYSESLSTPRFTFGRCEEREVLGFLYHYLGYDIWGGRIFGRLPRVFYSISSSHWGHF